MISIKTLIENTAFQPDVISEHGISLLINMEQESVIFDTGQSDAFIKNAAIFGTDISTVKKVVISHGHYDHSGGLEAFLNVNPQAKVYIKKEALIPKYSQAYRSIRQVNTLLINTYNTHKDNFIFLNESCWITNNMLAVTVTDTFTKFENDDHHLTWKNNESIEKDPFDDELFLILVDEGMINIVTGCAHRGIVNTVMTAQKLFSDKKINHIVGGFHLKNKSEERIALVTRELNKLNVGQLNICHCTGVDEYAKLKVEYKGKTQYISTGHLFKLI